MKLQDLILHNFRLKLFALLTAVLVWVTVHLATTGNLGPLLSSPASSSVPAR